MERGMSEREKTKAELDIEQRLATTKDELRQALLERARVFKSSWVELGEVLSLLGRNQQYKAWGYRSLTEYCQKELHIREATVHKLVGNFDFLSSHDPAMLERDNIVRMPDPDSLRVLTKAREDSKIDEDTYARLRESALTHGYSAATLHRKIKEGDAGAEGAKPAKEKETVSEAQIRQRIVSLVSSIRLLLGGKNAPEDVRQALSCLEQFARVDEAAAPAAEAAP